MIDLSKLSRWKRTRIQSKDTSQSTRISFRVRDNSVNATVLVGRAVFEEIGVKADDYVDIFFNDQERKCLYLRKANNEEFSFRVHKVMSTETKESNFLRIVFKCWLRADELIEEDANSHVVPYKIEGDVLIIDASLTHSTGDKI